MRVLLLGSNGMLGQAINHQLECSHIDVKKVAKSGADYCFDLLDDYTLEKCIMSVSPDVIINTAAIVDLEFCERNPGEAYKINGRLPGILANILRNENIYFIQISTDHYYHRGGEKKHNENEPIYLFNEYARSKYIGEQLALTYENTLVLRTNIVGFRGSGKPTFIEWALSEIRNNNQMNLFTDFYTSSIYTTDFAKILVDVIKKHPKGVYNLASSEVRSKKDFVMGLAKFIFGKSLEYIETSVANINGVTRANSLGLDTSKIETLLGYKMPGFEDTLASIKKEMVERNME